MKIELNITKFISNNDDVFITTDSVAISLNHNFVEY